MTEAQGWMALILGASSIIALVVRLTTGFNGLRAEIHALGRDISGLKQDLGRTERQLDTHGKKLDSHARELAALGALTKSSGIRQSGGA